MSIQKPGRPRRVDVVIYGLGNVGRALLRQIQIQAGTEPSPAPHALALCCVAVTDRSGILIAKEGFDAATITDLLALKEAGRPLSSYKEEARRVGARQEGRARLEQKPLSCARELWSLSETSRIFVDTSDGESAPLILKALQAGWHVVTANKRPLTIAQTAFDELGATAANRGVELRYGAAVSSGIPILATLEQTQQAGRPINLILGCFSSTLGHIFSTLSKTMPFSVTVRHAQTLGYAEPDPREDLSGMDVARKALILARTMGAKLELSDVHVEPLLPEALLRADLGTFFSTLSKLDRIFEERRLAAAARQASLRYVARIQGDRVRVGLEEVPSDSQLGRLEGGYSQATLYTGDDAHPIAVPGEGAGVDVTAARLLGDMIRVVS